jgi:hypothetical protein
LRKVAMMDDRLNETTRQWLEAGEEAVSHA